MDMLKIIEMKNTKPIPLISVVVFILLLDQIIKLVLNVNHTIGYHMAVFGEFFGIHYTQVHIPIVRFILIALLGLFSGFVIIRNRKHHDTNKICYVGVLLLFGSALGRLIDGLTVGSFETLLPFGLSLKTMDAFYINFGMGAHIFNLASVLGLIGGLLILYALVFKFSCLKEYLIMAFKA